MIPATFIKSDVRRSELSRSVYILSKQRSLAKFSPNFKAVAVSIFLPLCASPSRFFHKAASESCSFFFKENKISRSDLFPCFDK